MAKPRKSKKAESELTPEFIDSLMKQPAQLTSAEVHALEAAISAPHIGVTRRLALATLGRSMEELAESFTDREAAISMASTIDPIEQLAENLGSLTDMMKAAAMRLRIALCNREDMPEIMAAAAKLNARSKHERALNG